MDTPKLVTLHIFAPRIPDAVEKLKATGMLTVREVAGMTTDSWGLQYGWKPTSEAHVLMFDMGWVLGFIGVGRGVDVRAVVEDAEEPT